MSAEPEPEGVRSDGAEDTSAPDAADTDVPTVDIDGPPVEEDPLAQAHRERDEYLDHLRRERAAFENFRRRANKERMEALDRGAEQLVANLLDVLDTFGFALAAAADHDSDPLAKGVTMVHDQFVGALRTAGLEEVAGVGSDFDPNIHEAVLSEDAAEPVEHPVVTEVLRPGYRFKGRVLRPASVKVAK